MEMMKKILIILVFCACAVQLSQAITTVEITVTEDAVVDSGGSYTDTDIFPVGQYQNYDTQNYFKFSLAGLPEITDPNKKLVITSATFHINTTKTGSDEFLALDSASQLYECGIYEVVGDSWTESGITWANKPSYGNMIGDAFVWPAGYNFGIVYRDITAYVKNSYDSNDLAISVGLDSLSQPGTNIYWTGYTKEGAPNNTKKPSLIIVYDVIDVNVPQRGSYTHSACEDTCTYENSGGYWATQYSIGVGGLDDPFAPDGNPDDAESYFKFYIPELQAPEGMRTVVLSSTLILGTVNGYGWFDCGIYAMDSSWREFTTDWYNKPVLGELLTQFDTPVPYSLLRFGVRDYIQSIADDGNVYASFGLAPLVLQTNTSEYVKFATKEQLNGGIYEAYHPRIEIDYEYISDANSGTVTRTTAKDTAVFEGSVPINWGTTGNLPIGGYVSGGELKQSEAFLQFIAPELKAPQGMKTIITSASLKIGSVNADSSSPNTFDWAVYDINLTDPNNQWDEYTMEWATRPQMGSQLIDAQIDPLPYERHYYDIQEYLQLIADSGQDEVCFGLKSISNVTSENWFMIGSREWDTDIYGAYGPELTFSYEYIDSNGGSVNRSPVADTTVFEGSDPLIWGVSGNLPVGGYSSSYTGGIVKQSEAYYKFFTPELLLVPEGMRIVIESAQLKLGSVNWNGENYIPFDIGFFAVDPNQWNETTLNWNNRPATGSQILGSWQVIAPYEQYTFDMTNYMQSMVNANSNYLSFAVKSVNPQMSENWFMLGSKEWSANEFGSYDPVLSYTYSFISLNPNGDLNGDGKVDLSDLELFAVAWLDALTTQDCAAHNYQPEDINQDCLVDLKDFSEIARDWIK